MSNYKELIFEKENGLFNRLQWVGNRVASPVFDRHHSLLRVSPPAGGMEQSKISKTLTFISPHYFISLPFVIKHEK